MGDLGLDHDNQARCKGRSNGEEVAQRRRGDVIWQIGDNREVAVEEARRVDPENVFGAHAHVAAAVEVGALQQPEMALNASFLVSQERRERFDTTVERLASERAELMEFKLIGPLPAHSFVDGQLGTAATPAAGPTS